jgi:hypothetical protein
MRYDMKLHDDGYDSIEQASRLELGIYCRDRTERIYIITGFFSLLNTSRPCPGRRFELAETPIRSL